MRKFTKNFTLYQQNIFKYPTKKNYFNSFKMLQKYFKVLLLNTYYQKNFDITHKFF